MKSPRVAPYGPAPAGQSNTHKYTLTIKNTHVTKTVSASAKTNP